MTDRRLRALTTQRAPGSLDSERSRSEHPRQEAAARLTQGPSLLLEVFPAGSGPDSPLLVPVSRRGDETSNRTHCSSNCGAESRTVSAPRSSPDCGPAACADKAATDGSLDRIIWIGAGRKA
jgi:hypothetical protein